MGIDLLLELVGALSGVAGTAWLAFGCHGTLVTFVLYGVSNICWIVFAIRQKFRWMLVMNGSYAVTTVIGLIHALAT